MSKWITIEKSCIINRKRKTDVFLVYTKDGYPILLGQIKWHAPWRKYCFFPERTTVFEQDCLRDIVDFLINETLRYKNKKRKKSI